MIVADSSMLVAFLRKPTPQAQHVIETQEPAICGCILAELLTGARSDVERQRLLASLAGFHSLATPEAIWPKLGDNLRRLRERGLTVPFQDALIATVAMHYGLPVWAEDAHYPAMRAILPELKLFDPASIAGQ